MNRFLQRSVLRSAYAVRPQPSASLLFARGMSVSAAPSLVVRSAIAPVALQSKANNGNVSFARNVRAMSTNPPFEKLFVASIPWAMTEGELSDSFAQFGEVVSCVIIKDRDTGRSKGYGFVEFKTIEEASEAQAEMHETEVGGRTIVVNFARPQQPRENRRYDNDNDNDRF